MYKQILVAYNGSPESRVALRECLQLAPPASTGIHLLAVVNPPPYLLVGEFAAAAVLSVEEGLTAERERMARELEAGAAMLAAGGLTVTPHLEVGEPVSVIEELAGELKADLVIVGHSRQKPLALRWWRGSTDTLLVEKLRCSLLVASGPVAAE
ncbi:MAG: universal stress protein [Burkholderiaceae bacterium]|jgi:nucleotide-binding universal stress UspA family protein|nr:universal stress protein [Burkholderiaceae bacterium]